MSTRSTIHLVEHDREGIHVYRELRDDGRVWLEIDGSAIELATYTGAPGGQVAVAISRELWEALVERVRACR